MSHKGARRVSGHFHYNVTWSDEDVGDNPLGGEDIQHAIVYVKPPDACEFRQAAVVPFTQDPDSDSPLEDDEAVIVVTKDGPHEIYHTIAGRCNESKPSPITVVDINIQPPLPAVEFGVELPCGDPHNGAVARPRFFWCYQNRDIQGNAVVPTGASVYIQKLGEQEWVKAATVKHPVAEAFVELTDSVYRARVVVHGQCNDSSPTRAIKVAVNHLAPKAPAQGSVTVPCGDD